MPRKILAYHNNYYILGVSNATIIFAIATTTYSYCISNYFY